jgi:hypothetical protein
MRKIAVFAFAVILLAPTVPGTAGISTIKFMDVFASPPSGWFFWNGGSVNVGWQLRNVTGQEKMDVALLGNAGAVVLKMLGTGISNKFANMGQPELNYWYNELIWKPGPADVGCHYKIRVSTQDGGLSITSGIFMVNPALGFQKNGVTSYARLDTPTGGSTLLLGRNYDIKWTMIVSRLAWPSGTFNLKLMANINGAIVPVGSIRDNYGIDFMGCAVYGKYTWEVGKLIVYDHYEYKPDGKNGIKYRIRIIGEKGTSDSDDFLIGKLQMQRGSEKK